MFIKEGGKIYFELYQTMSIYLGGKGSPNRSIRRTLLLGMKRSKDGKTDRWDDRQKKIYRRLVPLESMNS